LGTIADNMADRQAKGRQARGDQQGSRKHPETVRRGVRNKNAILTDSQILKIRAKYEAGRTQKSLSAEYGTCQSNISLILRQEAWAHI
jgi:hypothetical protein